MKTGNNGGHLVAGDWVEVLSSREIHETLDERGTTDGLVFMPEMAAYSGRRFQVLRRAEQICIDGAPLPDGESRVRGFVGNDVVILSGLRCDGTHYGACKRGCTLFWKERWLKRAPENPSSNPKAPLVELTGFAGPKSHDGSFYCQSSELLKTTHHLTFLQRLRNVWRNVASGNYGAFEMLRILLVWCYWRVRRQFLGVYPRGNCKATPNEALNLQAGEWVEVKSLEEILATLDEKGKNRGLHFSEDMIPYCGRRLKVATRADNFVTEGSGVMRQLKNTVVLEGVICDSAVYAFGGCPRQDLLYWREIWLRRA